MTASVQGHPQLGCALANGQFVILNVKLIKNRPEEKRLYWQTPAEVDLGNPVSLILLKLPVSYSPDLHKTGFTDVWHL